MLRLEVPAQHFQCDDTAVLCLYFGPNRDCGPDITAALCVMTKLFTGLVLVWIWGVLFIFPEAPAIPTATSCQSHIRPKCLQISQALYFWRNRSLWRPETQIFTRSSYLSGPVVRKGFVLFNAKFSSTLTHICIPSPITHLSNTRLSVSHFPPSYKLCKSTAITEWIKSEVLPALEMHYIVAAWRHKVMSIYFCLS